MILKVEKIVELQAEIDRLKSMTYCAYCGLEFPLDDDAANQVSEHIRTCDKHPMRELEAESDRRLALLEDMENERVILGRACLICGAGHANDCELAEELK